ncbi:MAG TPA: hypothetical protein VHN74_08375, partial [Candidatus Angelobacter sp.]|nr:hypothetical protein [Candidatus Angelobacter sp.]
MKFSRKRLLVASTLLSAAIFAVVAGAAGIPEWVQNIEAHSAIERAIFRTIQMGSVSLSFRRPPAESVPALAELIKQQPAAELYSIKAQEEEQQLDFDAAERDWKAHLQSASDKGGAQLALADFYQRRHRPQDEVAALSALGDLPSPPTEKYTAVADQRSWTAFERVFRVIDAQALGRNLAKSQYEAWLRRYPEEQGVYGRYFEFLLSGKDFNAASDLVGRYQNRFPADEVFRVKAHALIAYRQGSVAQGLAVYEKNFQPLWPPELIRNYFALLKETHTLRVYLDDSRAAIARNPDDLRAAARIFYYYQQQGNLAAAQQAITNYRLKKETRHAPWKAQELYTFAQLLDDVHLYSEAARYYFALYNSPEAGSQEKALAGLAEVLLAAPDQQVRFASGDLSMYKDIATMDPGPGYLNGVLSLVLNTTGPGFQYSVEEQRAVPYFHRLHAAELITVLDQRFPSAPSRPALHATLIQAYASYGESQAVIRAGKQFLADFPNAPERHEVALRMADAYERTGSTKEEFAIYDAMLQELARKADGVPLGGDVAGLPASRNAVERSSAERSDDAESAGDDDEQSEQPGNQLRNREAFSVGKSASSQRRGAHSPEYQQVLDRYISRLVSTNQIPMALSVWRQELDRNTNDPGLYERFAAFLDANSLATEQEAVYKRAIAQFQGRGWYDKLARWYLYKKRHQELEALSQQVLKIFSGSELEDYLENVAGMPVRMNLQFNLYAHDRF